MDGYMVFKPVESMSWLLAENGPVRRAIILTKDLKEISDEEITALSEEYCIDEILFVHFATIRQERYFSTPARTMFKNIREFKNAIKQKISDLVCRGNDLPKKIVGLHHCFNHFKIFVPANSKAWLLAEKDNKRRAVFILDDMSFAIPDFIKSVVEKNDIDEVVFVVQRLLRKERFFDIDIPVVVRHAREFNLRKLVVK